MCHQDVGVEIVLQTELYFLICAWISDDLMQKEIKIPGVEIYVAGETVVQMEITDEYNKEMYYIIASAVIVFLYMCCVLRSVFLSLTGLLFEIGNFSFFNFYLCKVRLFFGNQLQN